MVTEQQEPSVEDVVAVAFDDLSVTGQIDGQEYIVQTSAVDHDGGAPIVAVDLVPNPMTEASRGAYTYYFRLESAEPPRRIGSMASADLLWEPRSW